MFRLTKRHIKAIKLLIEDELTNPEIAAQLGITPDCLQKWIAKPEFDARRKEFTDASISEAKKLLAGATTDAAHTLILLSRSSDKNDIVRFNSSMAILGFAGIVVVNKIAPTNPDGTQEYGLTDRQLLSKLLSDVTDGDQASKAGAPDAEAAP
jgi:hypothetical protein